MYYIKKITISIIRKLFDLSAPLIGPADIDVETYQVILHNYLNVKVYNANETDSYSKPILFFLHGGGWVIGSIKAYDRVMKYISYQANCTVIALDYRRAPEHKFPIALLDCYKTYKWIITHFFNSGQIQRKLIFCGDSAGGNLAIGLLKKINKDKQLNFIVPYALILIYPLLEMKLRTPLVKGIHYIIYRISKFFLRYFLTSYFKHESEYNSCYVSHIEYLGNIEKPIINILTAEYDTLTPSINVYAAKIKLLNSKVYVKQYPKVLHGFINFTCWQKQARIALADIVKFIKEI